MQTESSNATSQPDADAVVAEAVSKIAKCVQPHAIIVFGSRARGTARDDSDLDVLVIADTEDSTWSSTYLKIMDALWGIRMAIDVLLCSPAEFEKWRATPNHVYGQAAMFGRVAYGKI